MNELWKTIIGASNFAVSNLGRVKRLSTDKIVPLTIKKDRPLPYVSIIQDDGKRDFISVAHAAIHAFHGVPVKSVYRIKLLDGDVNNPSLGNIDYLVREDMILDIRTRRAAGESAASLAEEYEMAHGRISSICSGVLYPELPGPLTPAPTDRSKNPLTKEQKEEVRALFRAGRSKLSLSKQFKVTRESIDKIVAEA